MRVFLSLIGLICFVVPVHAQLATSSSSAAPQSGGTAIVRAGDHTGRVTLVTGHVIVTPAQGAAWSPKVNDVVRQGDSITAGKDGELHLKMQDESFIAIRPDTQFQIVQFVADGTENDSAVFKLLKGSLRSITGWIGKISPKNYVIRTPSATIGIRGTDHETMVVPAGVPGAEEGTYDKVNFGATYIENSDGKVHIDTNGAGFAPTVGVGKPKLLDHVPAIFKRTVNENLIDTKHEQIHKQLDQFRQERQKAIQERRETELKDRRIDLKKEGAERAAVASEGARNSLNERVQSEGGSVQQITPSRPANEAGSIRENAVEPKRDIGKKLRNRR